MQVEKVENPSHNSSPPDAMVNGFSPDAYEQMSIPGSSEWITNGGLRYGVLLRQIAEGTPQVETLIDMLHCCSFPAIKELERRYPKWLDLAKAIQVINKIYSIELTL